MTRAFINPKTGLVDTPIYPCYKEPSKGLCKLRIKPDGKFECGQEPMYCRYIKLGESEKQGKLK